jgi:hypothetical protein
MIYTDGIHLISDSGLEGLHKFARVVGLKRSWFQNHERHPHYDLTTNRIRNRAIKMGVKVVFFKTTYYFFAPKSVDR